MIRPDSSTNPSEEEKIQHNFERELEQELETLSENNRAPIRAQARIVDPTEPAEAFVRAFAKVIPDTVDGEIASPTLDQNEQNNSCMRNMCANVECGRQRVADGIGDYFKIKSDGGTWEPKHAVIISAQTGQGKNYFIENKLIPYVREFNHKNKTKHKVLIISNRIALKRQIENRIKGNDDQIDKEDTIYHYGEYADIMMYQGILNNVNHLEKKQEKSNSSYLYVICDEAHFFTSDAMFNPDTAKILFAIVGIFKNAIRVYMTATPDDCLGYICGCESKKAILYNFKRDYSYLRVMCYSEIDELFGRIVKSVNENKEKWLIFIDDKEKCKKVKEELEKYWKEMEEKSKEGEKSIIMEIEDKNETSIKENIFAVDANSKNDEAYREIILNEKLNRHTYVLISTSVLDNGVNLNGIHNIVISDISKVKSLQMAGRARVEGVSDEKTLYIKRFDEKYVKSRIDDFEEQRDAYHKYDLAYGITDGVTGISLVKKETRSKYEFLMKYYNGKSKDWENAKHWFGREEENPNKLYPNTIARLLLEKLVPEYKSILEEMRRTDEGQEYTGQRYLECQMSWFEKTYDEENDITVTGDKKAKEKFTGFLESYVGKKILKENDNGEDEQDKFRKESTRLCYEAFGGQDKNKNREYGIGKINKILKDYNVPYEVKSGRSTTGDKKTFWEVVRPEQEKNGI
jgi:hypothetical protein